MNSESKFEFKVHKSYGSEFYNYSRIFIPEICAIDGFSLSLPQYEKCFSCEWRKHKLYSRSIISIYMWHIEKTRHASWERSCGRVPPQDNRPRYPLDIRPGYPLLLTSGGHHCRGPIPSWHQTQLTPSGHQTRGIALLLTSGGHHWTVVQICSLEALLLLPLPEVGGGTHPTAMLSCLELWTFLHSLQLQQYNLFYIIYIGIWGLYGSAFPIGLSFI